MLFAMTQAGNYCKSTTGEGTEGHTHYFSTFLSDLWISHRLALPRLKGSGPLDSLASYALCKEYNVP